MKLCRDEALAMLRDRVAATDTSPKWTCRIGPVVLTFRNFAWRKRALAAHDLHHLMSGYPMTMRGEYQMAAWELGAGRFPHWGATLFCMPLVLVGLFWSPRRMSKAYRDGRRSRSLYDALGSIDNANGG